MDFKIEMADDVVVLIPTGKLVASTVGSFKTKVEKLVRDGLRFVLLDMSLIDFMDSSGLDSIIAVNKLITAGGGILVCASPQVNVRKVFRVTWADRKISMAETRSDGLLLIQKGNFTC